MQIIFATATPMLAYIQLLVLLKKILAEFFLPIYMVSSISLDKEPSHPVSI